MRRTDDPDQLTRDELARLIGVSYRTMRRWHVQGKIKPCVMIKTEGGAFRYLYDRGTILRLVNGQNDLD